MSIPTPDGYRCPRCKAPIAQGQTVCGVCKTLINWNGGTPQASKAQTALTLGVAGLGGVFILCVAVVVLTIGYVACIK